MAYKINRKIFNANLWYKQNLHQAHFTELRWAWVCSCFQGPYKTSSLFTSSLSLNVHHQWSDVPCCCCPYLEQSAPTCHICTLYVCFPRSPQAFPLQVFLLVTFTATFAQVCSTCAVTVVIFRHSGCSFYLHTYLEQSTVRHTLWYRPSANWPK